MAGGHGACTDVVDGHPKGHLTLWMAIPKATDEGTHSVEVGTTSCERT